MDRDCKETELARKNIMELWARAGLLIGLAASVMGFADDTDSEDKLYPELEKYVQQRAGEFDRIPEERKARLQEIATYVKDQNKAEQSARLVFICTHNSRRSHMSQIWAATAAGYYGIDKVETYSGGTEATAFNPRAVSALQRAGLKIEKGPDGKNPRYEVKFRETGKVLDCFSKIYGDPTNPQEDFCAVMTCSQADKVCPTVQGCSLRVALPFDDPKVADDTAEESAKYDERCAQISREMLYLCFMVGKSSAKSRLDDKAE